MSLILLPVILGSVLVILVVGALLVCKRVKRLRRLEQEKKKSLEATRQRLRRMVVVDNAPIATNGVKDQSVLESEVQELIVKYSVNVTGEEASQIDCSICLQSVAEEVSSPYGSTDLWVKLPCSHFLHASCLSSLLGTKTASNTCPLCRHPVDVPVPPANPLAGLHQDTVIDVHNEVADVMSTASGESNRHEGTMNEDNEPPSP
eukprot:TRINITY_DN367_c0_g6_i1.p1 TRINITY_DN367_c0_g6~~TRINITY_DN367_c0_g6_i1.p1  ORF type:complete len:204 (+),score=27.89 TRINITY_DN367_c0_g6_i1:49-660(+)